MRDYLFFGGGWRVKIRKLGCSLWGELITGSWGVYSAVGRGIFVVIMFYIYNNAATIAFDVKASDIRIIEFSFEGSLGRGVEKF